MDRSYIPEATLSRLPRYYRIFCQLKEKKVNKISSTQLAAMLGATASQVRQDFSSFGSFGQQGYGYNVAQVCHDLGRIIGVDNHYRAIVIGTGNLGRSVLSNIQFYEHGFRIIGIFEKKESMIGQVLKGMPVRHIDGLDEFCRENFPQMAILCIPPEEAALIYEQLISLGVKGFWNFSGCEFPERMGVAVNDVVLNDSLSALCAKMSME
ncbi:MAG: redox-sensing transcriptional repressor Rex [Clostridia bacterium]|nr:redox-sensing transcriptional repressor Rex [Clostridia bacterium]